uniref:RNA helicase n=1 Tax=Salarias fasciatus TaxID=181472 RepID=A0A672F7H6_SALFA
MKRIRVMRCRVPVLQCIMSNTRAASKKEARSQARPSRGSKGLKNIHIGEEVKIAVTRSLETFRFSDEKELEFPSSLTSTERAFIHEMARSLGYISKSKGKGSSRFLTIKKKDGSDKAKPTLSFDISHNSLVAIRSLLQRFPISKRERSDMQLSNSFSDVDRISKRLNSGLPMVPLQRTPSALDGFRRSLPVFEHQEDIVQLIRDNRVVLVVGETGSGKTTQIPQFLLDDCSRRGEACRIFCTQPRRLAAIAVAERVAAERGESLGQTVAYHIRLESRVSPKTLLTFCTSGVFLRSLMSGDNILTSVTHVIVDEVHERDGLTDFLLTKMRDVLPKTPSLRLILSSAALDVSLFTQYFGSCPVIYLKGRQFEVKELFLEDILKMTGFNTKDSSQCSHRKLCSPHFVSPPLYKCSFFLFLFNLSSCVCSCTSPEASSAEQLDPRLQKEMDYWISHVFLNEDQEGFVQIFSLIFSEGVSVDYAHSETGITPLMVAAGRGFLPQMEELLSVGADLTIKTSNGWSALDFAQHFQQTDAEDLLKSAIPLEPGCSLDDVPLEPAGPELSPEDQRLLELYHRSFDDQFVDLDLIMDLLHNICSTTSDGAVLIFLPGYDDIVALRDCILYEDKRFAAHPDRYSVFILHSDMQTQDQRRAMKTSPPGIRKIILSTNIAETSITINDVVFVIDSGKVKEKSFDTLSRVSMLKTVWISRASALQRTGRAGRCRPGICFRLFSRLRFSSMLEFQVPQLLRMPLQELCLQTKLLAPSRCPVADFLSRAPQPPPAHSVRNAVQMLKTIDAMDQHEDLTDLGYHLADLPMEPHLGKMVLCAVVLKCLDPILTIACTLAYRDPFTLPAQGAHKQSALHSRKRFTANTFSDHMALLRAFQAWQQSRSEGWEKSFCEKNFLSQATMDMILGMRTQLLGQLRAIGFVRARGGSNIRDVNQNSENWAVVKAALVAGMYPNFVHINRETSTLSSSREKKVLFHPTSVLSQVQVKQPGSAKPSQALPTDWLVYDEMRRGHRKASVRCCSVVTAVTIAIFGGDPKALDEAQEDTAAVLPRPLRSPCLRCCLQAAALLFELKQKWFSLLTRRIRFPTKPWSEQDEAVVQTLVSVGAILPPPPPPPRG